MLDDAVQEIECKKIKYHIMKNFNKLLITATFLLLGWIQEAKSQQLQNPIIDSLQQEIKDWIEGPENYETNGGQAGINLPETVRVDKEKIEELLCSSESINEINICD